MSLNVRVAGPTLNRHHVSQMSSNPSRLSPLIVRFKAWRTAQGLSQSKAARALGDAGLPIALRTLQQWEIGRRSPQSVTAAALERFLAEQEKFSKARVGKTVAPVIERLKIWRQTHNLSQSQAVSVLLAAGLPVSVRTLQDWEIGRRSPRALSAAALDRFLEQHPTITHPPSHRIPPPQS
jgi:DNA-binding transcriptional regulator YiaG